MSRRLAVIQLLTAALLVQCVRAQSHPFMIVKDADYPVLQALSVGGSSKAPFIRMRTDAINISNQTTYNESASVASRARSLIKIMDSTALAYIVDPANRNTYRDRFYQHLKYWDLSQSGNITKDLNINDWNATVPTAAAFFGTLVAMDIIHNDPNTTANQLVQRGNFNALMEIAGVAGPPNTMGPATFFKTQYEPYHLESLMSARALWALWKDGLVNNTALDDAVTVYKDEWRKRITGDGCYREYTGYALSRSGDPSRYNKGVFHDVIVYAGIDPSWYSDPKMSKFYEWLGGYALAPNRYGWPIGDSSYAPFQATYASSFDRAGLFSPLGLAYGEWQQNGAVPPAKLFSYLARARTPASTAAVEPPSRIFADGGAYLRQKNGGTHALSAVLTNQKFMTVPNLGHLHKNTNSLSIASFGEILLRGPGYNGYGAAASNANNFGFDFSYLNNHAVSENVALFNYSIGNYQNPSFTNDHRAKHGGYGVQGLLSDTLDYATGDSGLLADANRAIINGRHVRHTIAVYPQDGVNGYVYAIDELEGNASATTGQLAWHPYSGNITFNSNNSSNDRYEWRIHQKVNTTDQLFFSIFMPTAPNTKQQYDGLFADDIQGGTSTSFVGKYIFNGYNLDSTTKKKNVLTMFFPRKSTQSVPTMARISPTGGGPCQGAAFAFSGGVTDFAMESDGTSERTLVSATYDPDGAAARGKAVVYRKINGNLGFYFVGKGRSFKNTPSGFTRGFVSEADVDIHMKGDAGSMVSPGTNVTFYTPGNPIARVNGQIAPSLAAGPGFVSVAIPAGINSVVLEQLSGSNSPPVTTIVSTTSMVTIPAAASLVATVSDDGMPLVPGFTTVAWSKLSGPGAVLFSAPSSLATSAAFSSAGIYVLRIEANDGNASSHADVAIVASPPSGGNPVEVIYRETFGNSTGTDLRFNSPLIGWQHFTAPNDIANVTNASATSGGSDSRGGRPSDLDNISAGVSDSLSNGFAYSLNASRALVFTTEFPVDRSVYSPTTLSWRSHLSANNGGANNQSPAVRIGGQWYVITLSTATGGNLTQLGGGGNFNTSASLCTLDFASATATSSSGIVTSGWHALTASPGAPFEINPATVALPAGTIDAFGVYFTTAGASTARFDTFEFNAAIMPLATTVTLASDASPAYLGEPVSLTASVSAASGTPAGMLTFFDGEVTLGSVPLDASGSASFVTSALALGSHSLTASYAGETLYLTSVSASLDQLITLTPFNAWRAANFNMTQLEDPNTSGPAADPDDDGTNNLLEYSLDGDPNLGDGALATSSIATVSLPEGGSEQRLMLSFFRARSDLDYTVEGSFNLTTWEKIETNPGAVGETVSVNDTEPVGANPRFLHLKVTQP